jgi:hypothetical protein
VGFRIVKRCPNTVGAVSKRNRERRAANREAREAGAAYAQVRARRQRWAFAIGALLVAVAVALYFVVEPFDDDDDEVAATGDTTTTVAGAAGADCVAVADPVPEGAPEVPVQVGPPPTELVIEDLVVGDGEEIPAGATVTVDYIGVACSTGKIFDSSYAAGQPATFSLDGVISGWTEGIPGMKVGGQRLLGIPSEKGYGPDGFPPDIAPNESLWFVVTAQSFEPAAAPTDTTAPSTTETTSVPTPTS